MEIFGDLTTLVTLAIAVFIFLRLRSVLGKRTGHHPGPMDRTGGPRRGEQGRAAREPSDNVVELPGRRPPPVPEGPGEEPAPEPDGILAELAKPGTRLHKQLKAVMKADPSFDPAAFLDGARMAYEMIVTAFADGDRKTLRNLLSREVYDGFASAISDRESRGEEIRSSFVGIESADIKAADMAGQDEQVTVRFVSQIISATYDAKGELVEGDADQIAEVIDVWTFARDIRSRDPNWKLVATESDAS